MKNVKLYALMAMLLFTIPHSHGAVGGANTDTTIRVLLVADNLLVDPAVIADQVAFFEQTWTNTGLNAQATIQIVNIGDVPLEFYLGFSTPSLGYANWPGVPPDLWTSAMLGFPQTEENRGEEESL